MNRKSSVLLFATALLGAAVISSPSAAQNTLPEPSRVEPANEQGLQVTSEQVADDPPIEEKPPVNVGPVAKLAFVNPSSEAQLWSSLDEVNVGVRSLFDVLARPDGKIIGCKLQQGRVLREGVAARLCDDLKTNASIERIRFYSGGRLGFVRVGLEREEFGADPIVVAIASDDMSREFLDYEPSNIEPVMLLGDDQGSFEYRPNYPSRALRMEIQGAVHVLLGIRPDGRVRECRPTLSIGFAWMDHRACLNFLRSGRFTFHEEQSPDAPTRYIEETVFYRLN